MSEPNELQTAFESAQARAKSLPKTPTSGELLKLYGLYKQGTCGDLTGEKPGLLDFKGRAKFEAWANLRGCQREAAMREYITLVGQLEERYR